jgi:hypothetical protein
VLKNCSGTQLSSVFLTQPCANLLPVDLGAFFRLVVWLAVWLAGEHLCSGEQLSHRRA